MLSPTAEPKNFVGIMLGSFPMGDDFRATFDKNVAGMNGTMRVLKAGQVESRRTPEGVDLLATQVELQGTGGSRLPRFYTAANAGCRFEMLTYTTVNTALFQRYWPAVQQLVPTWSFANFGAVGIAATDSSSAASGCRCR
jgi:hypothetical protein